ncbi:J domain-containing protein [Pseudooceanicola sediminis]|uniref:J domain-containing protein n=1 Tax=Pseudooceanicola sediminis TaxID=2211117 RepID=A0A399J6K6_9RHOB|nr:J domain-containing protein [Pseudooceanicola sediminis]KAA2313298.1 J domain-containing protein [Puniceibacterium sp. HSS470]RII38416.1 J domain-containing protein [Pseudooceanicola sediminis]|tara:strand:- start:1091 stop:2044 length:954 start_codon:yes stop_codon:yes gene_type:complete
MPDDPYKTLGLTKSATADEIRKAYRKLVRTSHPDLHPDDPQAEARFKAIAAAHELLRDPETRARYDAGEIDSAGVERPRRQYYRDFAGASDNAYQTRGAQGRGGFGGGADPADVFAEILRNRSRGGAGTGGGFSAPGPDARFTLTIPFLEAARGGETRITLPDGSNLAVRIPQGTEDGQTLRLRGKGQPGYAGGPAGDALITVHVRPHPVFRRDGDDILVILPITIDEAVLGGKVTAPTIDGPVGLTIPKGASSGHTLRLRGRGIARGGTGSKGDQRVELRIVSPPGQDKALADFLTEWRKTQAHDPRAEMLKDAGT